MAEFSFPFENVDVSEDQFSEWASMLQINGVTPGSLSVSMDAPTRQLTFSPGKAFLQGFFYKLTGNKTLTFDSAGSNSRIDLAVLELDKLANQIVLKIVKGIEASSNPVQPSLIQSATVYQMLLHIAYIYPVGSNPAFNISGPLYAVLGKQVSSWYSAPSYLVSGDVGVNFTSSQVEFKDSAGNVRGVSSSQVVTSAPDALTEGHRQGLLVFENPLASTFTVNGFLRVGERVDWVNYGAGQVTFASASGLNLRAPLGTKTRAQYSAGSLIRVKSNEVLLVGDLTT